METDSLQHLTTSDLKALLDYCREMVGYAETNPIHKSDNLYWVKRAEIVHHEFEKRDRAYFPSLYNAS